MATSDYIRRNQAFGFCPNAILASDLSVLGTLALMSGYSSPFPNGIRIGMAAMLGSGKESEIVVVNEVSGNILTLGRGCCDTVPHKHLTGTIIWFFDDSIGRDKTEYGATEVIGVKVLTRTLTGGQVPAESSPAKTVTMNSRFARPYPPGDVRIDGAAIGSTHTLSSATSPLDLSWAHRDRVGQADLLVPHEEASIGPEAGTTYTVEVINSENAVVRTESGISGTSWSYALATAATDFGVSSGVVDARVRLKSVRSGLDSWQSYDIPVKINFG